MLTPGGRGLPFISTNIPQMWHLSNAMSVTRMALWEVLGFQSQAQALLREAGHPDRRKARTQMA